MRHFLHYYKTSFRYLFSNFLISSQSHLPIIACSFIYGDTITALLKLVASFNSLALKIQTTLNTYFVPRFKKAIEDKQVLDRIVKEYTKSYLTLFTFLVLGVFFVLPTLIEYLNPAYIQAYEVFKIILIPIFIQEALGPNGWVMLATDSVKQLNLNTFFSVLILLLLLALDVLLGFGSYYLMVVSFSGLVMLNVLNSFYLYSKYNLRVSLRL